MTECSSSTRMVYCLALDMVGSTRAGLELTSAQLDVFNTALVEQITPHVNRLMLTENTGLVLKFEGDGWLVMTDDMGQVAALCCLGLIMCRCFAQEMAQRTGLDLDRIPRMRAAVCAGRDIAVTLPGGRRDWVGDSARRAIRALQYSQTEALLLDEAVRYCVMRDLLLEAVDTSTCDGLVAPTKIEEPLVLYLAAGIRAQAAESDAAGWFAYAAGAIGDAETAQAIRAAALAELEAHAAQPGQPSATDLRRWNRLLAAADDYAQGRAVLGEMAGAGIAPDVVTYSTLISLAGDYAQGRAVLGEMAEAGIAPNVVTYNTLISLAGDYAQGRAVLGEMAEASIAPDVVTYSTLISLAGDYAQGRAVLGEMAEAGIAPNVVTYNTLISLAGDYAQGRAVLGEMAEAGIAPDVVTYNTLISLAGDYAQGRAVLGEMAGAGIAPDVVTYSTLISLAGDYAQGRAVLGEMAEAGIAPNVVTYNTLLSKDLSAVPADELLRWYLDQPYHPQEPIQAAIAAYMRAKRRPDALHLCLNYPHLQAARKVMRDHSDEALAFFEEICLLHPYDANGPYALGMCLVEVGRDDAAIPWLEKAGHMAHAGKRKVQIAAMLDVLRRTRPRG